MDRPPELPAEQPAERLPEPPAAGSGERFVPDRTLQVGPRRARRGAPAAPAEPAVPAAPWRRVLGGALTAAALVTVWLSAVAPDDMRRLSPAALLRIPVEGLALAALLLALPAGLRRTTRTVAWTAGALLGAVTVLRAADYGFYQVLDRPAHPVTDWHALAAGVDYVREANGPTAAIAVQLGGAVLALGLLGLLAASAGRVATVLRRRRTASALGVSALAVVWVVLSLVGAQIVPGQPIAARSVGRTVLDEAARARSDLDESRAYAAQVADNATRTPPQAIPLSGLKGKDVIIAFVESYGRTAVEDPQIGPGVGAVLAQGDKDLAAAGFSARSGWITSATFGGYSWLAHGSLLSGTWVNSQTRYDELLAGSGSTLVSDFKKAGWRTVAAMPATRAEWAEGAFYGYDQIYVKATMGYRGPSFGWSSMPDQFTMARLQQFELAPGHLTPVFSTIELTSSHTPWAPLPKLLPWSQLGDGSVYDPMPDQGKRSQDVWKNGSQIRAEYGHSIEYSVSSLLSWMTTYGTKDTVLIFLGDHQPAKVVVGEGASHDVPMAIVAKDPTVMAQLAPWGWSDGIRPATDAPVWTMDTIRTRMLTTFSHPAGSGPGS